MGKIFSSTDKNESVKTPSFVDRTNENWYVKKNANKIAFSNSIEDIIDGNVEFFDFTNKETSIIVLKNRKDEDIERNNFILFTINNTKVLVMSRRQLK
jgi:hypothetical protein